jgi:hypothetical protein
LAKWEKTVSALLVLFACLIGTMNMEIGVCAATSQTFTKQLDYTILIRDQSGNILGLLCCHMNITVFYGYWSIFNGSMAFHFESSGNETYEPPLKRLDLINETSLSWISEKPSSSSGLTISGLVGWVCWNNWSFGPSETQTQRLDSFNFSSGENPFLDPVVHLREEYIIQIRASDGQEWNSINSTALFEASLSKESVTYLIPQTYSLYTFSKVTSTKRPPAPEYVQLEHQYENLSQSYLQLEQEHATLNQSFTSLNQSYGELLIEHASLNNEVSLLRSELKVLAFGFVLAIIVIVSAFVVYVKRQKPKASMTQ